MSKIFKKLTTRYFKSILFSYLSKSSYLVKRFRIYNKTIAFSSIKGNNIIDLHDNIGQIFVAKKIQNTLLSEITGCSLYRDTNTYKVISSYNGYVHRNWVKLSYKKNSTITINSSVVNLIGVHKGAKHHFHFFFDYILPLLFFLRSGYNNSKLSIIVRNDYTSVQKEIYDMIKKEFPSIKFIYINKGNYVECRELIHIDYVHNAFYDIKRNKEIAGAMSFVRDAMIRRYNIKEKKNKDLLYISRKKTRLRRIINENSLKSFLVKNGFRILYLEGLSLKKQIEFFYNSKFIVSVHGASFTNLIFSSKDLVFLEIFPKYYGSKDFQRISKILNIPRYKYVENNQFIWQWFFVDKKQLISKVESILKSKKQDII